MIDPSMACSRCNGDGGYLQKSLNYPDDVEWDTCPSCDGTGLQK
jgi:DnaJ-class molecular chaperone